MPKVDNYQLITDRIIEQLEKGVVPWRRTWSGGLMPQNLSSGHEYRGINVFVLGCCSPYSNPYWLTFNQAKKMGGNVKKGEKGFPVVFWKFLEKEEDGKKKKIPMLRRWTVFNVEQCEGIECPELSPPDDSWNPIAEAEKIAAWTAEKDSPTVKHGREYNPCYIPALDEIQMPAPSQFESAEEYYSTMFHEMAHSTGHDSRLGRIKKPAGFGTHAYSKEELVAEMTAAFLCGEAGIEQAVIENNAAYIQNWLSKLKNDKRLLVQAAGAAQKAADMILSNSTEE